MKSPPNSFFQHIVPLNQVQEADIRRLQAEAREFFQQINYGPQQEEEIPVLINHDPRQQIGTVRLSEQKTEDNTPVIASGYLNGDSVLITRGPPYRPINWEPTPALPYVILPTRQEWNPNEPSPPHHLFED